VHRGEIDVLLEGRLSAFDRSWQGAHSSAKPRSAHARLLARWAVFALACLAALPCSSSTSAGRLERGA